MKVLVICNSLNKLSVEMSGMRAIYETILEVSKFKDVEIHVLSNLSKDSKKIRSSHLKFHYVYGSNLFDIRGKFFIKALELNKTHNFDIIHDFSSLPALINYTKVLGLLCNTKTIHNLCTVNENFIGSTKFRLLSTNKIVCSDKISKKHIRGSTYIPLVSDFSKFLKIKNKSKPQTLLFLGSLEERKGAGIAVESIKYLIEQFPKVKLTLASFGKESRDPRYKKNLQKMKRLSRNFSKNVKITTGKLNVAKLMESHKIFILPATSRHGTLGQPLTLLEAMAAGKVCVVSDIYRNDGLVENNVDCLLFKSGDSKDLAKKIINLLEDSKLSARLSRNAREKALKEFDVSKTSQMLYEFYDKLS